MPNHIESGLDILFFKMVDQAEVNLCKGLDEVIDLAIDARLLVVHRSDEAIAQVRHYFRKAEKQITLKIFVVLRIRIIRNKIQGGEDLVHALDVHDAWVQPRIEKQNSTHDVGMSDNIVFLYKMLGI